MWKKIKKGPLFFKALLSMLFVKVGVNIFTLHAHVIILWLSYICSIFMWMTSILRGEAIPPSDHSLILGIFSCHCLTNCNMSRILLSLGPITSGWTICYECFCSSVPQTALVHILESSLVLRMTLFLKFN